MAGSRGPRYLCDTCGTYYILKKDGSFRLHGPRDQPCKGKPVMTHYKPLGSQTVSTPETRAKQAKVRAKRAQPVYELPSQQEMLLEPPPIVLGTKVQISDSARINGAPHLFAGRTGFVTKPGVKMSVIEITSGPSRTRLVHVLNRHLQVLTARRYPNV